MNPSWDPSRYLEFDSHRLRPGLELLARIEHPDPRLVYDAGCGTGALTRMMADRWPEAGVIGCDTSPEMLASAAATPSRIKWAVMDVRSWDLAPTVDVLFSNAMLHWVPNHDNVIVRLLHSLAPGGVLAIQMPLSWSEPSHRLIRDLLDGLEIGSPELRAHYARRPVAEAEHYDRLLRPEASSVDIWETRYLQALRGTDPVLAWVEGTALRPLLDALSGEERDRFIAEYRAQLTVAYPPSTSGVTLYPFPRVFIVCVR